MERRGSALDIFLIGVILFSFGVAFLIAHYASNAMYDRLLNSSQINSSPTTVTVLQASKAQTAKLDWFTVCLFIGLTLALIISAWYISANPLFMGLYVIVILLAIPIAMILSNAWETISQNARFATSLAALPMTNHLLSYLPYYVTAVALVGLIVLFGKPSFNAGGDLGGGGHL